MARGPWAPPRAEGKGSRQDKWREVSRRPELQTPLHAGVMPPLRTPYVRLYCRAKYWCYRRREDILICHRPKVRPNRKFETFLWPHTSSSIDPLPGPPGGLEYQPWTAP